MIGRLLLAAILATTLASAQGKKGGGGGKNGGGDMAMTMPRLTKFDQFADKLKLSVEQKQDAHGMLNAALEQSVPLREQIEKGRVAIAAALIEGKTGDDLNKLMGDYTTLVAQMTDIEAKTFSKVYESLKPNQQAKAAPAFELLVAALEMSPGGGRAGGGRDGRGRQ